MVVSYPARTWSEGQTSLRRTALLMNAPGAGFKTVTTSPQYNKSSTMEMQIAEDSGRPYENGRIDHGCPPKQLRRFQCGKKHLHCLYLLLTISIIALMLYDSRIQSDGFSTMESNSKKLNATFQQIASMDRKIQSMRQDIRKMRQESPEDNVRRLSAQQQLALQDQQQDLDLASARQDFLEDYDLTQASLRAERQTRPRSESLSQQSPEETEGRQREPERVKAN